jgi:hypothetical protein
MAQRVMVALGLYPEPLQFWAPAFPPPALLGQLPSAFGFVPLPPLKDSGRPFRAAFGAAFSLIFGGSRFFVFGRLLPGTEQVASKGKSPALAIRGSLWSLASRAAPPRLANLPESRSFEVAHPRQCQFAGLRPLCF